MPKRRSKGEPSSAPFSEFVKFEVVTMPRLDLKKAPYNPRVMSDEERRRVKENIQRVGLIEPPVWNKRTGNLVGGHQRLGILDALHGGTEYMLPVAVVDLDEKTEMEQNVFLNNLRAQGSWDLGKLAGVIRDQGADAEKMGFAKADIYQIFGDDAKAQTPEELLGLSERVRQMKELRDKVKERTGKRDDVDYYLVVFATHAERKAFTDALGLPDNRFVNGRELRALIGK